MTHLNRHTALPTASTALLLCSAVFSAERDWQGDVNGRWRTDNNWSPSGDVGIGDTAIFNYIEADRTDVNMANSNGNAVDREVDTMKFIGPEAGGFGSSWVLDNGTIEITNQLHWSFSGSGNNRNVNVNMDLNLPSGRATALNSANTSSESDRPFLNFQGGIIGGGTLNLNGSAGFKIDSNQPNFTGTLNLTENTRSVTQRLQITSSESLSEAKLNLNNGTLIFPNELTNFEIGTLAGDSGFDFGSRTLTVGDRDEDATFSGVLAGTDGSVIKTGSGTWTLSGTGNTYTGSTTVEAGTLSLKSTGGGALQVNSGSTLELTDEISASAVTGSGALALNSGSEIRLTGNSAAFSGALSGSGDMEITSQNSWTLSGTNTHTGAIQINGTLITKNLGTGSSSVTFGNGQLIASESFSTDRPLTFSQPNSDAKITVSPSKTLTWTGPFNNSGKSISKTGLGTLILSNNLNPYSGTLTVEAGTVITSATALEHATVDLDVDDGLFLIDTDTSLGSLSGSGNISMGSQSLTLTEGSGTYSGTITGGQLHKTGTGTFVFEGDASGSGSTNLTGGSFVLDGTVGTATYSSITSSLDTSIEGQGRFSGALIVGGSITPDTPGASNIGTIRADSLELSDAFDCDISGTSNDQLIADNSLLFSGTPELHLAGSITEDVSILIKYGSCSGKFENVIGMPSGYIIDYAYFDGTDSNNIALVRDTTAPKVSSITTDQTSPTNSYSAIYTVTFTEEVDFFNTLADLSIQGVSVADVEITNPSNDGITYRVELFDITGTGTLSLSVNAASDVEDFAGNAFVSDINNINTDVEIDNTAPRVASITTTQSTPTNADNVIYTVTFDEAVENL